MSLRLDQTTIQAAKKGYCVKSAQLVSILPISHLFMTLWKLTSITFFPTI